MKTVAIIQARMGSTRLPGKSMLDLSGKTVLSRVIERTKSAATIDEICVATTVSERDDVIAEEALKNNVSIYRGSEEDVLDRFIKASEMIKAECVVRVTADNPLTEPSYIDKCALSVRSGESDLAAMSEVPYGSGAEAVNAKILKEIYPFAGKEDKEHVTLFLYKNESDYKVSKIYPDEDEKRPDIRITLDTEEDYIVINDIFKHFKDTETFLIRLKDIIEYLDSVRYTLKDKGQ